MDNSHTRRGAPCWYKLPEVGLKAVNDSLILEMAMFKLARNFFGKDKFYVDLVHLLQEVTWKTELGQLLDLRSADPNKVDFSTFTLETHTRIVKYKTAFYSFCLPVQMAYLLAGLPAEAYAEADRILIPMGIYFQVQDDYLDCYGDPSVIGKIGTDIQDNKCGWLIVQALKRASAQQRKVLEDNYARDKPECIARVKQVYRELQLEKVFEEYEARCKTELEELIANVKYAPKAVFTVFLKKIFKRQS